MVSSIKEGSDLVQVCSNQFDNRCGRTSRRRRSRRRRRRKRRWKWGLVWVALPAAADSPLVSRAAWLPRQCMPGFHRGQNLIAHLPKVASMMHDLVILELVLSHILGLVAKE